MTIKKKPFINYTLEEDKKNIKDIISIRLSTTERMLLNQCKKTLEQQKDSTTLKSLAWIGAKVIQSQEISYILGLLFKNKRNNKRNNIIDFE